MKKYVCDVCGYEYDPEVGDPENGIEQELHLKICRKIGYVLSVALVQTSSLRQNKSL